ncbi:hypothetical protein [Rickettsiella endosymbiont of Rhagonycha lignosa]|uniref:hypothetical protein n=1 Tax=Rickettsiella endosymbiont of Rhagonycha lignosa TaxID=3077937 RepID=UPI00313C90B8
MSYHEESTTLLTNCRHLYENVKSFKESNFEKNVYNKINEDINHLNTSLDNLLLNLNNNQNETDENKLFITSLGSIRANLYQIKTSINPGFRIQDTNKWVLTGKFFKNPPKLPLIYQQHIKICLDTFTASLNLLENLIERSNTNKQLKH